MQGSAALAFIAGKTARAGCHSGAAKSSLQELAEPAAALKDGRDLVGDCGMCHLLDLEEHLLPILARPDWWAGGQYLANIDRAWVWQRGAWQTFLRRRRHILCGAGGGSSCGNLTRRTRAPALGWALSVRHRPKPPPARHLTRSPPRDRRHQESARKKLARLFALLPAARTCPLTCRRWRVRADAVARRAWPSGSVGSRCAPEGGARGGNSPRARARRDAPARLPHLERDLLHGGLLILGGVGHGERTRGRSGWRAGVMRHPTSAHLTCTSHDLSICISASLPPARANALANALANARGDLRRPPAEGFGVRAGQGCAARRRSIDRVAVSSLTTPQAPSDNHAAQGHRRTLVAARWHASLPPGSAEDAMAAMPTGQTFKLHPRAAWHVCCLPAHGHGWPHSAHCVRMSECQCLVECPVF